MTGPGRAIWSALAAAIGRVRTEGSVAVTLTVVALVPAGLLVAWAVGDWGSKGAGPLLLWTLVACAAVALLVVLGRRWVRDVDERLVAAAVERVRELPEGSLRGIVELGRELPAGSSAALFRRAESELASRLADSNAVELAGELGHSARKRWSRLLAVVAGLALLTGVAGFAAPERARGAWLPLLSPVEHLRGPVYPALAVTPGDAAVDRGGMLDVAVEARLRQRVTVHWRSMGDVPRERTLPVESGRAAGRIGPVASAVSYWVEAPDGAVSDTFTATPRDPLMVTDLTLDLTYPRYVDRAPDHYRGEPPLLEVPEGTRLRVAGRASRPLLAAGIRRDGGSERRATVTGSAFELGWRLTGGSSGRWELALAAEDGTRAPGSAALEIEVVEDAPPRVRIAVPGADTLMPSSLRQPIVAEAVDDHALAGGQLVFRRSGAGGERGAAVSVDLPLSATAGRGSLRGILDASRQPLVPGDAIEYHVVVRDNSPAGQTGRSRTFTLRLPDMSELRDRARRQAEHVLDETRSLGERARELETGTRDLRRGAGRQGKAQRPGSGGGRNSPPERQLGYEEAVEAADVAVDHDEVLSRVDELEAGLAELERALEEAGLSDPELRRRLRELRERQAQLASPELRDQVEALREAAEALDPEAVRAALERLAGEQERFRERLEKSLQMMRRAAAEQEMNTLAREAEEIAGREAALAEALRDEAGRVPGEEREAGAEADARPGEGSESGDPSTDQSGEQSGEQSEDQPDGDSGKSEDADGGGLPKPPKPPSLSVDRAAQQDELEERAESLNRSLDALQQQLAQMGEQESSTQTGAAKEKGKASQQSMQQASREAGQQQGSRAAQSARRAADQMSEAARTLDEARQQMAASQQGAVREAVQQATEEALGMAERQESLRQQMAREQRQGGASGESLQQLRSDQAALQQGLQQLNRNLSRAGERSGMIDPEVARALERARMNMDRTVQGLEDGRRMPIGEAGRTVESLNQLAMSLLENEAGMQQAMGSSGVEEALRRLSQTAQEQGALNGRVSALDPMRLSEQARTRQLQQLGQEQRGLARQIGEASGALGGREDVLGRLDQLSAEAARLAGELEGGRLDPEIIQRQDRLFHRLLDAGRSLERDEYSDERLGRNPVGVETATPEALHPELLDPRIRYPAPTADQLERLPPAYRRLILDYFDRLNRSAAEVSEDAERPEENRSAAEVSEDAERPEENRNGAEASGDDAEGGGGVE